jgi:hypothetical protein
VCTKINSYRMRYFRTFGKQRENRYFLHVNVYVKKDH